MSDSGKPQLLHLVLGGELVDFEHATFKDLEKVETVGIFPNYDSAHAAWRSKAQQTVDNAHMRYFIVHLHRLLDPSKDVEPILRTSSRRYYGRSERSSDLEHLLRIGNVMSVISIQSQVAYGHVGNSAAVFPMQMYGINVMAVPTTLLSNRPRYPTVRGRVLDAGLVADLLVGLEERGAVETCRVILSGYLGSAQIAGVVADFVARAMTRNPTLFYCCDPVIGDSDRGVFVEPGLPELFRDRLCPIANILTPNQFELEWQGGGTKLETRDQLVAAARTLATPSSSTVVVTGACLSDMPEDRIATFAVEGASVWSIATPKLRSSTSGAGDLFAALFVASLIGGSTTAVALADAVSSTFAVLDVNRRGVPTPIGTLSY